MSENRYYWLKLKRDFFKRHDICIIEKQTNGKDYILFYLKLLCESVDHEGRLRFSDEVPYNEEMLAHITNTNVDVVRSAVKIFSQLHMMEVMDDGTFFMSEVGKMLGSETQWAEKKRKYREALELGHCPHNVPSLSDKSKSKSKSKSIELEYTSNQSNTKPITCTPTVSILSELSHENSDAPQKDGKKKSNPFPHGSKPYSCAEYLARSISEELPSLKPKKEEELQRWALDFDRAHRLDGHPWKEIGDVLVFARSDPFWRKNIRSGAKFRGQYERLLAEMTAAERKKDERPDFTDLV